MKVYLLILNYIIDGFEDTSVEVYSTKEAAQERMRSEYQEFHNDYAEEYPCAEFEEKCNDMDAHICMKNTCLEGYDRWRIVEQEVRGPKQYVLTEDLYKKLSDWHEQCYEEHPNGDMVYTDGELLDTAINLYEQISELTRQSKK